MRPTALAFAIKPHLECLQRTADLWACHEADRFLTENQEKTQYTKEDAAKELSEFAGTRNLQ